MSPTDDLDMEFEPDDDEDGWCVECGDEFHLDDTGGYNPPCQGCGLCRSCCECDGEKDDYEEPDDYPFDEECLIESDEAVGGPAP